MAPKKAAVKLASANAGVDATATTKPEKKGKAKATPKEVSPPLVVIEERLRKRTPLLNISDDKEVPEPSKLKKRGAITKKGVVAEPEDLVEAKPKKETKKKEPESNGEAVAKAAPKGKARAGVKRTAAKSKAPVEEEDEEEVVTIPPKKTASRTGAPVKEEVTVPSKKTTSKVRGKAVAPVKGDDEGEEVTMPPKKVTSRVKGKDGAPVKEDDSEEEVTVPAKKATSRARGKVGVAVEEAPPEKKMKASNATATPWSEISFLSSRSSGNGKEPSFHITSWNVGGLRAWHTKGGLDILMYDEPDILCLQETKCTQDQLPEEIKSLESYKAYWCTSSDNGGYAGVGILTKTMPIDVTYGIGNEEQDVEGRCITAEYKRFYLVNVYVPNAGRRLVTLPKRLEWNELFKSYIKKLDANKPVIICGDLNVSHAEIDLANPKTNTKSAGFTPQEREGMTDLLKSGFIDAFRHFYPDQTGAYTFWTYISNARARNVGWRLDYFITSERIIENMCDVVIHDKVLGSDHCPVTLHLDL